jgi:hypothetical protein
MFRPTPHRSRKSHSHCDLPCCTRAASEVMACPRRSDAQFASRMELRDVQTLPRSDAPKSLRLNSFADPHPLTTVPSILYKKGGGEGVIRTFTCSDVLTRGVPEAQGLSPLDATLMHNPGSVDSKWLTDDLLRSKSLSCNLQKTRGVGEAFPLNVQTFRRADVQTVRSSHCGARTLVQQSAKVQDFFTISGNNSAPPGV